VRAAQHIAVEGVRLAVRRNGPSSAPVGRRVLLLHGAGHTSAIWAPLVDELATDRPVVAVDRRGYGESEAATAPALQEARDYGALLVRDGDETAGGQDGDDDRQDLTDVVAEGDGIDVALALAALRPDLVGRLVLIGGPRRTGGLARWTGQRGSPSVEASAPDRVLLIASAPKGAVPAQALMKSLVVRAEDPSTIRMVTLPEAAGDPLEAAPAAVTTIVAGFLREN
jgi:pimeloyl-ACP methyl ester carboxylesterase